MRFEWPNLTRCCFCMPLRRGVLTFGYLNIIFSAFMIGVYSYVKSTKTGNPGSFLYHGAVNFEINVELCITIYLLEIVFNTILLYGAHNKSVLYIKIFYYYGIATTVAALLMQVVEIAASRMPYIDIEMLSLVFAGLCLQCYLLTLVKSLLDKLQMSNCPHHFENQLQQIVIGDRKSENRPENDDAPEQ